MKCPHCGKETQQRLNRVRRLEILLQNLIFGKTLEFNFRRIMIKGYDGARRTFARDLKILEKEGKIILNVNIGGKGTSTLILKGDGK